MQIVFHLGAHCTDDDLLIGCLLENAELLARHRILVPPPESYRSLIRDTIWNLRGQLADADMQDALLDTILEDGDGDLVVFSSENFIIRPRGVLEKGPYYGMMEKKAGWLRNLFPDFEIEFCIGLRDPATHVPALYDRQKNSGEFSDWSAKIDMNSLSWLRVITDLRKGAPDARITVWCNEDTPLIWPEVLRAMAGHPETVQLEKDDNLLATIMSEEGLRRMRTYLATRPPRTVTQRRRIVTAFLNKFALDEAMEDEVELPGWTEQIMDVLSERYEGDIDRIEKLPGVRVILP